MSINNLMVFISCLLLVNTVTAHPVVYKGGTVIGTESNSNMTELHIAYSFHQQWSLGLHTIQREEREFDYIQLSHLLKRWNNTDSQANIYTTLGLGAERKFGLPESEWSSSQMIDLMADWEDRDYYVQAMQRYIHLEENRESWHSRLRLGLAPFRSDSHELGIWGIVQFDKVDADSWTTTNLLRFYYKNVLWEIGASLNGSYQLNLMLHL